MNHFSNQFIYSEYFLKCFFFKKRALFVFFFLSFLENFAQTQGLCIQGVGTEKGAFSVNNSSVCSGQTVTITDASGGNNVSYYFGYEGTETQAQLIAGAATATTSTPLLAGTLQVYTILQIGKKNGKDMYACRNVTVRPDSKPFYAPPSNCGPNFLSLEIPLHPTNTFDSYEVNWGDGTPPEIITTLPFNKKYTYSMPLPTRTITVKGIYNNTALNCPAKPEIVTMDAKGDQPKIVSVELLPNKEDVKIIMEGAFKDHELFARSVTIPTYPTTALMAIQPGETIVRLPPNNAQTCFTVFYYPDCPKTSGEVCTVKLDTIEADGLNNSIKWQNHPLGITTRSGFVLIDATIRNVKTTIIQKEKNTATTTYISPLGNPYVDVIDCKKEYCYQIEMEINGVTSGSKNVPYSSISRSAIECISRKNYHPPALTEAFVTVTDAQKNSISFRDNSGWVLNKEVFRINRSDQPNAPFNTIDSTTNIADTRIDPTAQPETASYCYQIDYRDECGSTSLPSPVFCNVHLTQQKNSNLQWTTKSPFADSSLDAYEVFRYDELTNAATSEASYRPAISHVHTPDYSQFQDYATFRVKSTNAIGKESWSNLLKIPLEPKLFLPTAFSPNNDGDNDELVLKGNFGRITSFSFTILNRWGETIFTSNSLNEAWDGTLGGKPAPEGYYFYQIKAITNTNEIINKKGQIILLR